MRQIKFREWDPEREKMYGKGHGMSYSDRLESDNATMFVFDHEESDDNREEEKDVNGVPFRRLMQYTGLKDKNGREIYEGDLLRVELDDDPDSYYIAPVTWCGADYPAFDIMSKYWPKNVIYDTNVLSAIVAGWSEEVMSVIGNIYENPELMEVAEHER